jgi:protein gp37
MSDKSKIEWTDATWNPIRGCSRISEGCRNCYAESVANRFKGAGLPYEGLITSSGAWNGEIKIIQDKITEPLRWKKPRRIFVNSMSDLFHEKVDIETINKVFAVMSLAQNHTFQILTKRADRMHEYLTTPYREQQIKSAAWEILGHFPKQSSAGMKATWPLPNIWLGASVEDQITAEKRIPLLLKTPAAIRWISAEPLINAINLSSTLGGTLWIGGQRGCNGTHNGIGTIDCPKHAHHHHDERCNRGLDWVVAGGESGKNARRMKPDWIRSLRDQCVYAKVPFFFKQWGEYGLNWYKDENGEKIPGTEWQYLAGKKIAGRELDGRIWDQFPGENNQ